MSLLGREYLSVAVEDDGPPGPGDALPTPLTTTRPRRLVRGRRRASARGRVARPDALAGPRPTTR